MSERVRLFIGRDGMFPPAILPVPRLRGSVRDNRQHTNVEGIVVPYVTTGSTLGRDRLVFESTTQLGGLGSVDRKGSLVSQRLIRGLGSVDRSKPKF